jgi:hypothetical protein
VEVRLHQERGRDPFALAPTPSETPSTIHVTIGKIEVRATPEAARTRQKTGAPEASGLDDYLRQRAKGNRR